ncbi:molybdenum cofactor biosynthesis protein B [Methanolobus sp. ZRKC3]|uniref:MogA/MoaB family molybdenum cofactor biosynthesis protein n=1 Tax=Methanolobus sp. ZRKC3 TaxID=3125786 RepID=UPI00324C95ED
MKDSVVKEHKMGNKKVCNFAIITVSTSRFEMYGSVLSPIDAQDISGEKMAELIRAEGHNVLQYSLVSDDMGSIIGALYEAVDSDADIIITTGGTGLASTDVTIESVTPMFEKNIPGFGELFRYKSIEQIGTSVILTRADAGLFKGKAIFCLPGSPAAVELAVGEIILPETGHIIKHALQ